MVQRTDPQEALPRADERGALGKRLRCVHYLWRLRLAEGGIVRAVFDICAGLAARGHDITILTADAEAEYPAAWSSGSTRTPRIVTMPMPWMFGRAPVEAERCLAVADVLHLHGAWDVPSSPCLARLARRLRLPYIVSTHGQLNQWELRQKWLKKKLFLELFGRRHLAGAAAVHCTAEAELAQISQFLPPGKGKVVPLPIDLSAFVDLPGPQPALSAFPELVGEIPRVLLLSRLCPQKRPDLLIEAAFRLKTAGQSFRLILAGPGKAGYVSYLRQLVVRRRLEDCVLFTGMVSGVIKISLYQAASVFVLPTWMENFGYVLFEALAAGTPVVTTRRADMWQELQAAGTGIVECDPDAIASSIRSLLSAPARARELGQQGRAWVFRKFGSERVFAEFEQLYRQVGSASPKQE